MHNRKISVIGLGYVGLPVAVAFGKSQQTIGFDINQGRVEELQKGTDRTLEVTSEELTQTDILFTCTPADLQKADFHIVAVPTPINDSKQPDLRPLIGASKTLGPQLKKAILLCMNPRYTQGPPKKIAYPY